MRIWEHCLDVLQWGLNEGRDRPRTVLRVEIDKPGTTKKRMSGVQRLAFVRTCVRAAIPLYGHGARPGEAWLVIGDAQHLEVELTSAGAFAAWASERWPPDRLTVTLDPGQGNGDYASTRNRVYRARFRVVAARSAPIAYEASSGADFRTCQPARIATEIRARSWANSAGFGGGLR
jgi:hypothetical protein